MHSISWPLARAQDERTRAALSAGGRLRLRAKEWAVLVAMSVLVACAGTSVSSTTLWLQTLREGRCRSGWYLSRPACEDWADWPRGVGFVVYVTLSVLLAAAASGLVWGVAPDAAMSGIPSLKSFFQGFSVPQLFLLRTLAVRIVGICLASASGLWIGQEAPLAYVGVAVAGQLAGLLPISGARVREMCLAAASTGIAVAFSAPVGGVLFGLEVFVLEANVLPQHAVYTSFLCAAVAVVVLRGAGYLFSTWAGLLIPETGLFRVSSDRVWHSVELVPFAIIGVLGGVYGALTNSVCNRVTKIYHRHPILSAVFVALVTAIPAFLMSEISRMPSMELLADLFAECTVIDKSEGRLCADSHWGAVLATFVLAAALAPLSFTLRIPSGILFPSIVVGALGGRLFGLLASAVLERLMPALLSSAFCPDAKQHCITPGVYALVGAASVLTGVTGLTVSSVVIIFETTGALTFIVPIMTGVIVAKWVTDTLGFSATIYTKWQSMEGLPFLPNATAPIPSVPASTLMTTVCETRTEDEAIGKAIHTAIPIVANDGSGVYKRLLAAKTSLEEPTLVVSPSCSLRLVISSMTELGIRVVVVCEAGIFRGLITRADVVNYLSIEAHQFDAAADEFEIDGLDDIEE